MVTEEDERIVAVASLAEKEETDDSYEEEEILPEDEMIEEDE